MIAAQASGKPAAIGAAGARGVPVVTMAGGLNKTRHEIFCPQVRKTKRKGEEADA